MDEARKALLALDAPLMTRVQHLDLMAYLPFDILTKVDIAAMANSLEVRVPLLDHHVVELAATMPSELQAEAARTAALEQEAHPQTAGAAAVIRRRLIDRPKMGFGVPIGDWMAGRPAEEQIGAARLTALAECCRASSTCRRSTR